MGLKCCPPVHEVRGSSRCTFTPSRSRLTIYSARYIDPTLDHDLTSHSKPWALSPLISTMPHFVHGKIGESDTPPEFPPQESLEDDNSHLAEAVQDPIEREKLSPQLAKIKTADQRRTHFANKDARKSITFGPNVGSTRCHRLLLPVFHVDDITHGPRLPPGPDHNRFLLWVSRVQPRTSAQNSRRNLHLPQQILGRSTSPVRML
jgi:hypothetical protein